MASALCGDRAALRCRYRVFCNMYLAYETLSDRMKEMIGTLRGVNESGDPGHWSDKYESMHRLKNAATEATHPIVRVHPETGRKSLYLSPAFTTRFEGMTVRKVSRLSTSSTTMPRNRSWCRLHWQASSLALWDNRVSLHHAVADYFGEMSKHRRVMRRATIEGKNTHRSLIIALMAYPARELNKTFWLKDLAACRRWYRNRATEVFASSVFIN